MPQTTVAYPNTAVTGGGPVGATAWTSPGNATRDDGSNATVSLIALGASQVLTASDFNILAEDAGTLFGSGIKIPAAASIVGLRFYYEYSLSSGNSPVITLAGLGHSAAGVAQAMAVRSYGWGTLGTGSTVNVGNTWNGRDLSTEAGQLAARADLADPGFTLSVSGSNGAGLNNAAYAVDHVRIEVQWILRKDGAGAPFSLGFGSGIVKARKTVGVSGAGTGTFPTTGLLDNFNRANENPIAAPWVNSIYSGDGPLSLSSNQLANPSAIWANAYLGGATYGPDVENYCTIGVADATNGLEIVVKITDGDTNAPNGYFLHIAGAGGQWQFWRIDAGFQSEIGAAVVGPAIAVGDQIGVAVTGSTLTAYHKPAAGAWTTILTRTDTTYQSVSGHLGYMIHGSAWRLDDMSGGTRVPSTPAGISSSSFGSGVAKAQASPPAPASSSRAFGSGVQKPIVSMAGSTSTSAFASAVASQIATRSGVTTTSVFGAGAASATVTQGATSSSTGLATGVASQAIGREGDVASAVTFASGAAKPVVSMFGEATTSTAAASGEQHTVTTSGGGAAADAVAAGIARAYSFAISGFAYDQSGGALEGVRVDIYRTSDHFHMGRVTTGPTGYYSLAIPNQPEVFWVRFYKPGPPEIFDTTGDNLVLVESQVQGPP